MRRHSFTLVELPVVSGRERTAFTLVELLVVVAIVALLISILLPALNKARDLATAVACQSNMRQIVTAFTMYAQEHEDYPPPVNEKQTVQYGSVDTGATKKYVPWFSVLYTGPYLGNKRISAPVGGFGSGPDARKGSDTLVVYCPSLKEEMADNQNNTGIGYNNVWNSKLVEAKGGPTKWTQFARPSQFLILCDVGWPGGVNNYKPSLSLSILHDPSLKRNHTTPGYRHSETSNVAFSDAHIESFADLPAAEDGGQITVSAN